MFNDSPFPDPLFLKETTMRDKLFILGVFIAFLTNSTVAVVGFMNAWSYYITIPATLFAVCLGIMIGYLVFFLAFIAGLQRIVR